MTYTVSQAFPGRGTELQYNIGSGFTTLAELKKIDFSGSKYDLADVSNMDGGNFREWLPTLADSGELSFDGNYVPADQSQKDLLNSFNNATLVAWQVVLPGGRGTISFNAYVQELARSIPVDKEASVSGKLKITGKITIA